MALKLVLSVQSQTTKTYISGTGTKSEVKDACKIPGCELWLKIVKRFYQEKTFYLVGGKQAVIEETVEKLKKWIPS